jgi:hypothetical protein
MADNTLLNLGNLGDTIRTLDKTGTGIPKTEVVALDLGGGDGRSEFLSSYPLPISLPDVSQDDDGNPVFSLSPSTIDALEILFRQTIAQVGTPQTPAEKALGVVPVNPGWPQGWVQRYGLLDDNLTDNGPKIPLIIKLAQAGIWIFWPKLNTGTYLTSVPLIFASATIPIFMRADPNVRLKAIAAMSYLILIDGHGTGSQFVHGGELTNFVLDGNGLATDGLYLWNVISANFYRIRATNVTNAGLHLAWAQLCLFDTYVCSNNVETFTTVPTYGILIDNANGGGSSSANDFFNPTVEQLQSGSGVQVGIKAQWAINSIFINGSSEGNKIGMIIGDLTTGSGIGNSLVGMDMESNVQADLQILGIAGIGYNNDVIGGKCTTTPSVTFTASVGGAASGTLTVAILAGIYTFTFSDAEVRVVTVAAGGTACTWTTNLSAGTITTATLGNAIFVNGGYSNHIMGGFNGGVAFDVNSHNNTVHGLGFFGTNSTITDNGTNNSWTGIYDVSSGVNLTEYPIRRRANFVLAATGSVTIDCSVTRLATVTYNGASAGTITFNSPTNARDSLDLAICLHVAGAGTVTLAWASAVFAFKVPAAGLTVPANGFNRTYYFNYDPNNGFWYFAGQTVVDVPN